MCYLYLRLREVMHSAYLLQKEGKYLIFVPGAPGKFEHLFQIYLAITNCFYNSS